MSSSATTLPISSTVSELWLAERDGGSTRALLLAVRNEVCTLLAQRAASGTVAADFAALADAVPRDGACYVLYREEGSRWVFVSFIPDSAPVREKTLYASALAALRRDLGEHYFVLAARFSRADEFDWAALQAAQQPVECLNEREQHIRQLDAMEATARAEMEAAARDKAREKQAAKQAAAKQAPATATASATAARPMPTPPKPRATTTPSATTSTASTTTSGTSVAAMRHAFENPSELPSVQRPAGTRGGAGASASSSEFGNAEALGGYHTVTLPFTRECGDALERLRAGTATTVVMRIESETVALVRAGTEGAGALGPLLDGTEPRFLLHRAAGSDRTLFVYCCPDRSRPQLRMVYATAKPSVVDEAERHGLCVAGKMEVRSGAEVTAAAVADALRPRRAGAGYGCARASPTVNRAAENAVRAPHPVYSQIAQNRTGTGPMKRIVLPPSAAY